MRAVPASFLSFLAFPCAAPSSDPHGFLECVARPASSLTSAGAILKAGESKKVDVAEMDIVLTIGNVALNNGAEGKAAKVFATVEDEDGPQKVLLATLRTPACEQAVLDITFPTGALPSPCVA